MKDKKRWWEGHEEEIMGLVEKNKGLREIAEVFGVSTVSVWRATRELDKVRGYLTSFICWEKEKSNIEKMILDGLTYSEIADKYNTSDTTVRRHISELGIDRQLIRPKTKYRKYSDAEITDAVKKSVSYSGVLRELGLKPIGGNISYIHKRIDKLGLDTSHFTGQLWSKGKTVDKDKISSPISASLEDIFANKVKVRSVTLKERLIRVGFKESRCECCGNNEWNGKPIPTELHHIDGNHDNNALENLQILCPNCHAQTDSYRGRGVTRSNYNIPTKEELLTKLRSSKTVKQLAKDYYVSEGTIREWVKKNNMKDEWVKTLKEIKKT